MLAGGVCQAEAGSGGTGLAFRYSPFQRRLTGPGTRILPARSPAKARWGYRRRAQGVSPPSRLSPCPELRWGGPLPHCFPTPALARAFALRLLLQGDSRPDQAPFSALMTHEMGGGKTKVTTYPRLPDCEQAQLCVRNSPHPYK